MSQDQEVEACQEGNAEMITANIVLCNMNETHWERS